MNPGVNSYTDRVYGIYGPTVSRSLFLTDKLQQASSCSSGCGTQSPLPGTGISLFVGSARRRRAAVWVLTSPPGEACWALSALRRAACLLKTGYWSLKYKRIQAEFRRSVLRAHMTLRPRTPLKPLWSPVITFLPGGQVSPKSNYIQEAHLKESQED